MEILIVVPKYALSNKKNYEYSFPLGLGYISSVIKQAGHGVNCLNLNHFDGTTENLVEKALNNKKYDAVCSGHIGIGFAVIEKIINTTKKHPSRPKLIIGGGIVTAESQLMFESLKPDIAVIGEGELTIVELLNYLEKNKPLKEIKGIVYWDNERPIFTQPRELIEDLDSLPSPDFEGIGFKEQLDNMASSYGFDYPRIYPILCSRGCPFQCTFCYHCLGIKYRIRSLDDIMEELKSAIKKYRINVINFYDDLFSINKERLSGFCRRIKKLISEIPWECRWNCQLSVQNVDKEMLRTLKDSGCYAISFGFESYSQTVLNSMKKPITPEQINRTIKLLFEEKMVILGNFIFGDVAETKETAKETLDFWKKNCKGQIKLYFIQPYPGSQIFNRCVKKRIIKDKLDFIKNEISHLTWLNMTDKMTNEEVLELKRGILKARRNYYKYTIPIKIEKNKTMENRHNFLVKCPFCKKIIKYRNCSISNRLHFTFQVFCKNCNMNFYIVSRLYKIGVNYYQELDFLRKKYFLMRDNLMKKKI